MVTFILVFFAIGLIPFFIALSCEYGWIYAVAAMTAVFVAASPFLIQLFLVIAYVIEPYFISCWFGTALGVVVRQIRTGPEFVGPMTNPIWHGAVAGAVTYLAISLPVRMLRNLASGFALLPDLGTAARGLLMAAMWGTIGVVLFSRLRGAARMVGYTGGMAMLVMSYSVGSTKLTALPTLLIPKMQFRFFDLLSMWTLIGLGQIGLLYLMRRHFGSPDVGETRDILMDGKPRTHHSHPNSRRSFGKR